MCKVPREISRAADTLGSAIERFERRIAKAARRKGLRRRLGARPSRLPAATTRRPPTHRPAVPVRYRRGPAGTVLRRLRLLDERRQGGTNRIAAVLRAARTRIAAAVRRSADAVRRGIERVRGRRLGLR